MLENPKGEITENFGRIQSGGGVYLENERMGRGGDRESHQKLLGGMTQVTYHSKEGSAKTHNRSLSLNRAKNNKFCLRSYDKQTAPHSIASPQTSFGVRLSSIHFSPTDVC